MADMCLGIPAEIVDLLPDQPDVAKVNVNGTERTINIGLLADEELSVGTWVLVHLGFAMSVTDETQAQGLDFLEGIGQEYAAELAAAADKQA